ncbi:hypothetical protein Tco_0412562 [Tanacetum coccineum]
MNMYVHSKSKYKTNAVSSEYRPRILKSTTSPAQPTKFVEFLADSAINLVTDSSKLGLQSGYEEFPLFSLVELCPSCSNIVLQVSSSIRPEQRTLSHLLSLFLVQEIVELGLDKQQPAESFSTSGQICPLTIHLGVFSHLLMAILASAAVLEGMAPFESRICRVGTRPINKNKILHADVSNVEDTSLAIL